MLLLPCVELQIFRAVLIRVLEQPEIPQWAGSGVPARLCGAGPSLRVGQPAERFPSERACVQSPAYRISGRVTLLWLLRPRRIDWFEFDSATIKDKNARIRPYTNRRFRSQKNSGTLTVKVLAFYEALARTSVLKHWKTHEIMLEMTAAFIRYALRFSNCPTLTVKHGIYKDAEVAAWSARIGDALGYLTLQQRGYKYFDHFESFISRLSRSVKGKRKRPDFIVYHPNARKLGLLECKGHILKSASNRKVEIKKDLKDALDQVSNGVTQLGFAATCCSTASYILEEGYKGPEPSLIAVVEEDWCQTDDQTDGVVKDEQIEDEIVRGNYGAWLRLMGLEREQLQLLGRETFGESTGYVVLKATYRGMRFLFPIHQWVALPLWWHIGNRGVFWRWTGRSFGLEESIFRTILEILRFDPDKHGSMSLAYRLRRDEIPEFEDDDNPAVRISPDGGIVADERFEPDAVTMEII